MLKYYTTPKKECQLYLAAADVQKINLTNFFIGFETKTQYIVVPVKNVHNIIHNLWISPFFIEIIDLLFNYCLWITIFVIIYSSTYEVTIDGKKN